MIENQTQIMVSDFAARSVSFSESVTEARDLVLSRCGLIGRVTNAAEQTKAVAAQSELAQIVSEVERTRKQVKQPLLDFERRIDDAARKFRAECDPELLRLSELIGDYQALEQEKQRAAERLKQENITGLERDRATELATAKSHDEADAINERYTDKAQLLAEKPAVLLPRAKGQVVKSDWEITVTDLWLLAKAHPTCVKITPLNSEIKLLLDADVKVSGVTAERVTKSSVRVRQQRTVEV